MSVYQNDEAMHFKNSVESLLNQTYKPSEIVIIVDGYVPIKIIQLLNYYKQNNIFNIIWLEKNRGLANALNLGVLNSKYGLIARMDSDDIAFSDRFEIQIDYMLKHNLDLIGGQIIEFGKNIKDIVSKRKVPLTDIEIKKAMKTKSPFSHPTVVFKKSLFDKLNGYDTNIFPEDYDFFVRANLNNFRFGNVPNDVLWFRIGGDKNKALRRRHGLKYAKNEFNLYKKFYKIGYYNLLEFVKVLIVKIPLRILPFFIFKYLYYNFFRKI